MADFAMIVMPDSYVSSAGVCLDAFALARDQVARMVGSRVMDADGSPDASTR